MQRELQLKYDKLKEYLQELGSVVVGYSSGVDSTFLLKVASDVLGKKAIAATVRSCSFPEREFVEATAFCKEQAIEQIIVDFDEMEVEGFYKNPKDRCYYCKKALFSKIQTLAFEKGFQAVVEGSNVDDDGDYRPGHIAIEELGIKSPLRFAGLTKNEIRELSKELGLYTYKKPSYACLASRIPYGETITKEKLKMVEKAEALLMSLGFSQMRVRIHGTIARIEVLPEDFSKLLEDSTRKIIYDQFQSFGFSYVSMDLMGYRMGSMNETLQL